MMKVMVLGSGAREHALAWKLAQSPTVEKVLVGPGNAGTAAAGAASRGTGTAAGENVPTVDLRDFPTVLDACRSHKVDCVFVGPEAPLAAGVVDYLAGHGIAAIGPNRGSARLESSKAFSKAFLQRNGLPTASAREFTDPGAFGGYLDIHRGERLVIKKSGLAAGKGVLESSDTEEMKRFGGAVLRDDALLVEEFLVGWEVSIFGVSDGRSHIVLPPCTDFKKANDGDTGPNTGGMGSICPVPRVDAALMERIAREVVEPTYAALQREALDYKGVLYFGLMVTAGGPKILEFNVRFGDPETQVLMPVLGLDFGALLEAVMVGDLAGFAAGEASRPTRAALGVVVASKGYPDTPEKGALVEPFGALPADSLVFHAGTSCDAEGRIRTPAGRCFTAVGLGPDLAAASAKAYAAAGAVRFSGGWYRRDIGGKFIGEAK
jgi:phosphoribosylamine---glycine ligase